MKHTLAVFRNALGQANIAAHHLRLSGSMDQDKSLTLVIDMLEMAMKAMRAVPDIAELDARITAEFEAMEAEAEAEEAGAAD